jgi:hypothetical protein
MLGNLQVRLHDAHSIERAVDQMIRYVVDAAYVVHAAYVVYVLSIELAADQVMGWVHTCYY